MAKPKEQDLAAPVAESTPLPVQPDLAAPVAQATEADALSARVNELVEGMYAFDQRLRDAEKTIAHLRSELAISGRARDSVRDLAEAIPEALDTWKNESNNTVQLTLHSLDGHREIPVALEPGETIRLPAVYAKAVKNAAPQLVMVDGAD